MPWMVASSGEYLLCVSDAVRLMILEAESLRVRIEQVREEIFQRLDPDHDPQGVTVDLSGDPEAVTTIKEWVSVYLGRSVNYDAGDPLYTFALFKVSSEKYVWYLRAHHVVCDGYSGMLIARRVAEIYTSTMEGYPPPESTFGALRDLVENEVAYRSSAQFELDRDFWVREMSHPPLAVSLAPLHESRSTEFVREVIQLSLGIEEGLRQLAQETGSSLASVMFALLAAYLHRVTGAEDLVIGLPVLARVGRGMRSVPGAVANVVPLRVKIDAGIDLANLVRQVGRSVRQALRHQRYRAEDLRRDLGIATNGESPFRVLADYSAFDYRLDFAGSPGSVENLSNGIVEDLSFEFYDFLGASGFRIEINFNAGFYSVDDAIAHKARFERLLETVVADPGHRIGGLQLLGTAEREQLLYEWNDTASSYPGDRCIHELFEAQVERTPEATAVVYEETSLSYGEMNRRANRLAHHLRRLGVKPDDRVGICVERSLEMIVGLLGILKAGGAYVPLDPAYPADRLAFMLEDSAPVAVLTQAALRGLLGELTIPVLELDGDQARWAAEAENNPGAGERGAAEKRIRTRGDSRRQSLTCVFASPEDVQ